MVFEGLSESSSSCGRASVEFWCGHISDFGRIESLELGGFSERQAFSRWNLTTAYRWNWGLWSHAVAGMHCLAVLVVYLTLLASSSSLIMLQLQHCLWNHTGGSQQKLKEEHEHRPRVFVLQLPLRDAVVICMTTAALFGSSVTGYSNSFVYLVVEITL